MKKSALLSAVIIAWAATANAQSYQWAKGIGSSIGDDVGNSIAVDDSGNTYMTGGFFGTADFVV